MTKFLSHRTRYLLPDGTPVIAIVKTGKTSHEWQFVDPRTGDPLYLLDGTSLRRFVSLDPVELVDTDLQLADLRVDTGPRMSLQQAVKPTKSVAAGTIWTHDSGAAQLGMFDPLTVQSTRTPRTPGMCPQCDTMRLAVKQSVEQGGRAWRHFACPCGRVWKAEIHWLSTVPVSLC